MPCVSKCCCCCSLKYGNLTYGIISLASRICGLFAIYFWTSYVAMGTIRYSESVYGNSDSRQLVATIIFPTIGSCIGWFICSCIALFIALKGIIQKRSILLYPYIVMLIIEAIVMAIICIFEAATIAPWLILQLVVIGCIDVYVLILCLFSSYQHMKQNEKSRPISDLCIQTVKREIQNYAKKYKDRLSVHPNELVHTLMMEDEEPRRLKKFKPSDLPTRFD